MPRDTITPMEVEKRLLELSDELDEAQDLLAKAEMDYAEADYRFRMASAEARLRIGNEDRKTTADQRKDEATVFCKAQDWDFVMADARVKIARSTVFAIRSKIEVARSLGTSVRSSMDLL
jgi:hypothetical protein